MPVGSARAPDATGTAPAHPRPVLPRALWSLWSSDGCGAWVHSLRPFLPNEGAALRIDRSCEIPILYIPPCSRPRDQSKEPRPSAQIVISTYDHAVQHPSRYTYPCKLRSQRLAPGSSADQQRHCVLHQHPSYPRLHRDHAHPRPRLAFVPAEASGL